MPEYVDALRAHLEPRRRDWFAYKDSEPKSQDRGRPRPLEADRPGLGPGRRGDDQRRLRGAGRGDAGAGRAGRRGDLPVAAVVLLRVPDPRRRWRAGPGAPRAAGLRARPRRDRRGDHAADPGRHLQLAAQPQRPGLPARDAPGAGRDPDRCLRTHRPPDLPDLRRALQPDPLRRPRRSTPRPRCIRTRSSPTRTGSAAGAGHAHRLPDRAADDARPRGVPRDRSSSPSSRPATPSRTRCCSTRSRTSRSCRSTSPPCSAGATGWSARCARSATRRRCRRARSTSWPARRSPTTWRSPTCSASTGCSSCPGTIVEVPGWFRISLTATDEMVERGIPGFAAAYAEAVGLVKPAFVAGFGPIVKDTRREPRLLGRRPRASSWRRHPPATGPTTTWRASRPSRLWPLSQAAEACFGTETWPADLPEPQAWMELDVESPDDVAPATAEMADAWLSDPGRRRSSSRGARRSAHLLSPEGILVGIVYTPWMHKKGEE